MLLDNFYVDLYICPGLFKQKSRKMSRNLLEMSKKLPELFCAISATSYRLDIHWDKYNGGLGTPGPRYYLTRWLWIQFAHGQSESQVETPKLQSQEKIRNSTLGLPRTHFLKALLPVYNLFPRLDAARRWSLRTPGSASCCDERTRLAE